MSDVEGYSLFKIGEIIFASIILVILLGFIYSSTSGQGLRETQESIDLALFMGSLDAIDNLEVSKVVSVESKYIIKDNFVKVGNSKREFSNRLDVDYSDDLEVDDRLVFVKEKDSLEVKNG